MGKQSLIQRMALAKKKDRKPEQSLKNVLDDIVSQNNDVTVTMDLSPLQIRRSFNPRDFPISLEAIKSIDWPSLDTDLDDLDLSITAAIESSGFSDLIDSLKRDAVLLEFLKSIHKLAFRIREEGQIQEISVKRTSVTANSFDLIAGERRLAAFLYAGTALKKIRCRVYSSDISKLRTASIQDGENCRDNLQFYEITASKYEVWKALSPDIQSGITTTKLGLLWGYHSRGVPSLLRKLFERDNAEYLVKKIYAQKLNKEDVVHLLNTKPSVEVAKEEEQLPLDFEKPLSTTTRKSSSERVEEPRLIEDTVSASRLNANRHYSNAKKYGLVVNTKSNLSVVKLALNSLIHSQSLTSETKKKLSSFELSTPESVSEAWALVGEALEGST